MKEILPQNVIDQIRLTVRTEVKMAFKDVVDRAMSKLIFQNSLDNEQYLSSIQASQFLKIKLGTLYRKVENGEIPFSRIGKRKLIFNKVELINYISKTTGIQMFVKDIQEDTTEN